ncbi:MAG: FixH family protein [Verrucomicrobia bacterium]|nr:FixH family protein [Verrucomicrobiota bacterium]
MNAAKPPRSLWPVAITTFFILAALFLGSFVIYALRQREDLVAANYYENEIRYQQQIDLQNRSQAVAAQVVVTYEPVANRIVVTLPAAQARGAAGKIHLYRPSDASLDRDFPLTLDADNAQQLDATKLQPGLWKVRVQWTANGQEYFIDQRVIVAEKKAANSPKPQNGSALFWTAVAERSGDTAFASHARVQKRRGASLPAALQNGFRVIRVFRG